MNSIQLMMDEHQNILRMLSVVRKACKGVLNGDDICYDDFYKMIDFIRNYADAHHHGKEEKILFHEMVANLGPLGNKLITHGMLVEHDSGRLFMQELEASLIRVKEGDEESKLDVIANAISYTHLLQRHIDKEDKVIYPFGVKQLSPEIMEKVEQDSAIFEEKAIANGVPARYISLLESLEAKYL